ncbi:MAG: TonB-dependent receptor [Woeseia sp.]
MQKRAFNPTPLARGIALALGAATLSPAVAQEIDDSSAIEEITVRGIRGSLTTSMNRKRDAQGVVDAITSEDIGKFPDTNLAESLQRISGVSIDREIGEGARVTVRGVGPDFNLVTLNGRQMPASSIEDTTASNSRAFDFANLASESIAAVEVYKTSRASIPTGGIGATINIVTARPLANPGRIASIGAKALMDQSTEDGDSVTPEVSGIYSDTFADDRFGVAITGSYQDRALGFNQAAVPNGWKSFKGDTNDWGTIPQEGSPGFENITNRPGPDDTYSVPQNLLYSFNEVQRTRTNGQLALQFRPVDAVTATLDYTYSENEVATQRSELSVWFNWGASVSSWGDGPIATPLVYSETIDPAVSDLSMGGGQFAATNENNSLGFNLEWQVSERLGLELDYHDSDAESAADSPYGSNSVIGVAGFYRGTTTADFTGEFPVMSVDLPPGQTGIDASQMITTGTSFRNSYMKSDVEQLRLGGGFDFTDDFGLDFGIVLTDVNNRSAFSNVQRDTWGGAGSVDDYPDSVWIPDTVAHLFDNISGSGNPNLFNEFFRWDFDTVADIAAQSVGVPLNPDGTPGDPFWPCGQQFCATDNFGTDRITGEESSSAYLQLNRSFDIGNRAANLAVGVRYEETEVTSSALVPIATEIRWAAANEFSVVFGDPDFTTLTGKYDYVLPSLDFNVELVNDVIVRAAYSETIGRPGWGDIQGGQTINQLIRIDGGDGQQGEPGLLPLESQNFDLSFEWYYGESSYLAAGYFRKDIDNYIGVTQIQETPFNLAHPGQGARYDEANAATGGNDDLVAIRQYIFDNYGDTPEVEITGVDSNGNTTGFIDGIAGEDPIAVFDITVPANQRSAELDGWEFAVQHMFGDSGFGTSANYTVVDSNLAYDNVSLGEQFAIEGLSDSANIIGFYENERWQARVAYNWRDEFLSGRFTGQGPNPSYTEAYGQWDVNVSYQPMDGLTIFAEGINVTDEIQRVHGRTENELLFATQAGPRYTIGARYSFE